MSIKNLTLPKYELTLPISGVVVVYRPFTVKEEKLLLLAQEEGKVENLIMAAGQIIEACTFGSCEIGSINKVDAEYLFVQIRNKSKGEGVDVNGICKECGKKTFVTLDFTNVQVKNIETKTEIKLADNVWVTMRIPTLKESLSVTDDDGIRAIALCLDTMIEGESVLNFLDHTIEERIEWVDNLPPFSFEEFNEFFDSMPILEFTQSFKCVHCEAPNFISVEGMESFFD